MDLLQIISVVLVLAVLIVVAVIITKVVQFFNKASRTVKDIAKHFDDRELLEQNTPKSIGGMESLVRPKIENDFPTMSLDELKSRDIDEIYAYFHALDSGDHSRYADKPQLDDRIAKLCDDCRANGVSIKNIKIHKQAVYRYNQDGKIASIELQTALEYRKSDKREPESVKTQSRVKTEWVYLLDSSTVSASGAVAANCPNCGAPVSNLGSASCQFCGSHVERDFTRLWILNDIAEF